MNTVMHSVSDTWYRLYWWFVLVVSVIVAGGSAAKVFAPKMVPWAGTYGLGIVMLVLAAATIIYCATFFWPLFKRNQSAASFGASALLALLLFGGLAITGTGTGAWPYAGVLLVGTFFAGMYGIPTLVGTLVLIATYVFADSSLSLQSLQHMPLEYEVLLGGAAIIAVGSALFWRTKYTDSVDNQLSKLTGALKSTEEQSAILLQSIADGVIVTDTHGKVSLINRAAANMTGWTVDEARGMDVDLIFKVAHENGTEISKEEYPFAAVLVHKAFYNQVLQLTSRSGKKIIISLVISPVVTASGAVYGAVGVLRDVSEQRAAEQQRAEFISTASHEMRTPVAAIEGYLSLALNDKVSSIDSRARGFLEKAHSSTQHLGQLFQDLLTSAKAEDGRLSNHPAVVEMGAFLEQLTEDLRFGAQKKGLNTDFVIGNGGEAIDATSPDSESEGSTKVVRPLYYVYVDPDRVREVITNLFDNAVKYTEQGKVSIGLTGNTDVVQLYISDTGNGIPAEDIPHLFQKFYRVDNSATRTIGGTGLGLFIARKIIELYRGRIWVESELGKGSTFYINLPRLDNRKAQELSAAAPQNTAAPQAPAAAPPAQ